MIFHICIAYHFHKDHVRHNFLYTRLPFLPSLLLLILIDIGEKCKITRGTLLGQNSYNQNTYIGFHNKNGSMLVLSRWIIHQKKQKNKKVKFEDLDADVGKMILSLEQEMNSIQKLQHPNLVEYLGLSVTRANEGHVVVHVAQE